MADETKKEPTQSFSNGLGHIYAGAISTVLAVAYYHSNIQPLDFQPLAPIQPILHGVAALFGRDSLEALVCGSAEVFGLGMFVRGMIDRAEYKKVEDLFNKEKTQYQQPAPVVNPAQPPQPVVPQVVSSRVPRYTCLHSGNLATTICPTTVVRHYDPCRIPSKCTMHTRVRP